MNSKNRNISSAIINVAIPIAALLIALSSVSPGVAGSNLANWLAVAGFGDTPTFLSGTIANTIVQLSATALLSCLTTIKFMRFLSAKSESAILVKQNLAFNISVKMENLNELILHCTSKDENISLSEIMPELYVIRQDMVLIGLDISDSIVDPKDEQATISRVVNSFRFIGPLVRAGHIDEVKKIMSGGWSSEKGSGA